MSHTAHHTQSDTSLDSALRAALARRGEFFATAAAANTDCYRILHGITEGQPGLAVDRYGDILLVQTWRDPLPPTDLQTIETLVSTALGFAPVMVWNHRNKPRAQDFSAWHQPENLQAEYIGHEYGLRFCVSPRHRGIDPLLFLDLRAGRRQVQAICAAQPGLSVLNLFAYTCGVGVVAAAAGAGEICNVDFAESSLAVGKHNHQLNQLNADSNHFVQADAFVVARQMAGLAVRGRFGTLPKFKSFARQQFDLVVLDPPKWAKSPFGVVDLVRDYQSVFKPALLVTRAGGQLLITNNVAQVDSDEWLALLRRCVAKNGRTLTDLRLIEPDEDFPSFDYRPPLKMALLRIGEESP